MKQNECFGRQSVSEAYTSAAEACETCVYPLLHVSLELHHIMLHASLFEI